LTEAEVIERFVGRSHEYMVSEIEAFLGRSLAADWEDRFQPWYRDAFATSLVPVDGVIEALGRIALPTCVASSSSHERLRFTLGLVNLYDRFAGRIFSASEVGRGKPAPDLFLHAARSMGVAPSRTLVVEDTVPGIRAAKAAGMIAWGFTGGSHCAGRDIGRNLAEAGADRVFDRMTTFGAA
jgi:HAD superfamily hydrolase (TIGR01509 family)